MPDNENLIELKIPQAQIDALQAALNPKQLEQAKFQIIKRTTNHLAAGVKKEVRRASTINRKYVDRAVRSYVVTGQDPIGLVRISQQPVPAIGFQIRENGRKGITAVFVWDRGEVALTRSFIARVTATSRAGDVSEHRGVFSRTRHLPTRGPNVGAKNKHGNPKYRLTATGYAGRLSIRENFAPSVMRMVSIPSILAAITTDTQAFMTKQADSQIDRFTKAQSITNVD